MKSFIWYEKYRQKEIEKLSLDSNTKRKMKEFIENKSIPHLLFSGPPGSGKTTLAMILIDHCASNKLELNGSSKDRGVDTIKTKVSDFAKALRSKKELVNIVFIDEADGLTNDAQNALRNTMEKYQSNCRFIFTANDLNAISEAIFSRCMHFSFSSIPKDEIKNYCLNILKKEEIKFRKEDVSVIVDKFYPDIRTVLNNLQACSHNGILKIKELLDGQIDFLKLSELIKSGEIRKIRQLWIDSINFNWLWKYLINDFIPEIDKKYKFKNNEALEMAIAVADYMFKDRSVVDKEINASACVLEIMNGLKVKVKF